MEAESESQPPTQSCLVCFSELSVEKTYHCSDSNCTTGLCEDCIPGLFQHFFHQKLVPTCMNEGCRGYYIISGLNGLTEDVLNLYEQTIVEGLLKDKGDEVQKRLEGAKILERLREERLAFLRARFPPAIMITAETAFKSKMNSLERRRMKRMQESVKTSAKRCPHLMCKGFLNGEGECPSCGSVFCKQCEKLREDTHVCKQEDLDSLKLLNSMIRCPGCNLPVQKSEGCDSITCANCKTKFLYSSGKAGGHGSSNKELANQKSVSLKRMSNFFKDVLSTELLDAITVIEAEEPPQMDADVILTSLRHYIVAANNPEERSKLAPIRRELVKRFDKWVRNQALTLFYNRMLIELEKQTNARSLTIEVIKKLHSVYVKMLLEYNRPIRTYDFMRFKKKTTALREVEI